MGLIICSRRVMGKKSNYQCPHCASSMFVRTSKIMHPLSRLLYFQCGNHECSFSCCANLEIIHQLSPSAIPNQSIQLKTLSEIKAARKAANDEYMEAEQDD